MLQQGQSRGAHSFVATFVPNSDVEALLRHKLQTRSPDPSNRIHPQRRLCCPKEKGDCWRKEGLHLDTESKRVSPCAYA